MKRISYLLAVLLIIVMASGCSNYQSSENVSTINSTGYGIITTQPDTVEVRLSVITEGKNKNVQEQNATKTQKVIDALIALGLTKDEMETKNIRFTPIQRWDNAQGNQIIGYRAENTLLITTINTDKAGAIVDTAVNNGAEMVGNLNFMLSDEGKEKLLGSAMEKAVLDARKQAETAAAAAGVKITGIKNINIIKGEQTPPIYFDKRLSATDGVANTPVIPENAEYTITVQASFEIG